MAATADERLRMLLGDREIQILVLSANLDEAKARIVELESQINKKEDVNGKD